MANAAAVLERAGLGILADNDDSPGPGPVTATAPASDASQAASEPARQSDDFERFLADLKQEVEQPLIAAMVQALRSALSRLARTGAS